jgi:DNA-binding transcriptional LysR family regulator
MRLRYIELFHAILSTGSLTGAARLLNISQPAASKALQHAEDQLGFAMFSRVHGRLRPTPQALLMRQRIDDIMQEVHDLQRLTSSISEPEGFPLRVTCTPTLAMTLLADAAVALREAFPGTSAELSTQHSVAMAESLVLRETDIGITLQGSDHYNLCQEALPRARDGDRAAWLVARCRNGAPIAGERTGQPADGRHHRARCVGQLAAKSPGAS